MTHLPGACPSKSTTSFVYYFAEPAHFEYSSRNMTVKRTAQATLQCDARGDPPIQLQWTHNMKRVELTTYR